MFRICNHLKTPLKFIKNIHGDMIYTAGGKRSIWVCTNCGKTILMDEPFYMGEVSDGYHTFNELYHHRAVLFSVICNSNPELAWKSKLHHDGTMYDGMFIVGIETPEGQATYHYDIDPYWEMFSVQELPKAPEWDGHTPAQAIERISKLSTQPENEPLVRCGECAKFQSPNCAAKHEQAERDKGCAWCNKNLRFECYLIDDEGHTASIENNVVQTVIAEFCPMCGKRLEVKQND